MANRRDVNVLDAQALSYVGELGQLYPNFLSSFVSRDVRKRICLTVHLNETKNTGKINVSSIAILKMSVAICQRLEDRDRNDYAKLKERNESSQETTTSKWRTSDLITKVT